MDYFFSAAGLARLEQACAPCMLCVFDFDGTLAPIAPLPGQVRLASALSVQLRQLAQLARVAVLSGRAVADLAPRLGFEPHYLVGNHGIEGIPGWDSDAQGLALTCSAWARQLDGMLTAMREPGLTLENKTYSLSLHYRHAADPAASAARLMELFRRLEPAPRIIDGKFVFNLLPQDASDKGKALVRLMAVTGACSALYVGDDVTDEDVFRLQRADVLTIRTDYDGASQADFHLAGQAEMPRLLDALAGFLDTGETA